MNRHTALLLIELTFICGAILVSLWAVTGFIIHEIPTGIVLTFIAALLLSGWLLVRHARLKRRQAY